MEGLSMTNRFERLSRVDQFILFALVSAVSNFLFPQMVVASTPIETPLVFEIKNFPTIKIEENVNPASNTPVPKPLIKSPANAPRIKIASTLPPKAVDKVYMHEPEIRAYLCPKFGNVDKCNTFIAILKAENGTHECTRDNRGLNRNGTVDVGLAQINWNPRSSPYTFEQLQDCKFNLDIAMQKYAARGFQPWAAYNKGAYKKHLPAVIAASQAN